MFVDTRRVDENHAIEKDLCVIGAGVAGITLALELDKHGIGVCLLESGGEDPDDATLDLNRGENVGIPYSFANGSRNRYLGGSSNCWEGWCRPLDPWDFERRDWVPHSGWPIGETEISRFYDRTHASLRLGPRNYEPEFWEAAVGRDDVRRYPFSSDRIVDTISQFSPPIRFGLHHHAELRLSKNIDVYLYANAIDIDTDPEACTVRRLQVKTLSGRTAWVRARAYVLATGGIENARLLLASNRVQPKGLGNGNDLVGRYFMDHPRLMCGRVRLAEPWVRNKLYDARFHHPSTVIAAHDTCIASQFALASHVQREEGLLNSRVWLHSVSPGEGTDAADALIRCKTRLSGKNESGHPLGRDFRAVLGNPGDAARFAVARAFRRHSSATDVRLQAIVEPAPDPESRVLLSNRRDPLGMPRVEVRWRLGDLVKRTFDRTFEILIDELERHGIAEVDRGASLAGADWPVALIGTQHHMGTTRMHDSPRQGVVDSDCRVHGTSNLYIAGSSVFPTVGANFPTFTLVALALRLADHLKRSRTD